MNPRSGSRHGPQTSQSFFYLGHQMHNADIAHFTDMGSLSHREVDTEIPTEASRIGLEFTDVVV